MKLTIEKLDSLKPCAEGRRGMSNIVGGGVGGGRGRKGSGGGADVWRCPRCGMTYPMRGSGLCPCGDATGEAVELVKVEQERVTRAAGQQWSEEKGL